MTQFSPDNSTRIPPALFAANQNVIRPFQFNLLYAKSSQTLDHGNTRNQRHPLDIRPVQEPTQ